MKINEKLMNIIIGVLVAVVFIVIISIFIYNKINVKYTFNELEVRVVTLAEKYYNNNKKKLPKNLKSDKVKLSTLAEVNKVKPFKLKDKTECNGHVEVYNNEGNYIYIPHIKCGKKTNKFLKEEILNNEDIKLNGHGLYKDGNKYTFRGENLNNYVTFNDREWLIVSMDDDSIKLLSNKPVDNVMWDDRYNVEKKFRAGINEYVRNNLNSRIKDTLEETYNDKELFTKRNRAYLMKHNMCIDKVDITKKISYGCNNLTETYISLLTPNDYVLASLDNNCNNYNDRSCNNYNYLTEIGSTWTPSGVNGTTDKVYYISQGIEETSASNYKNIFIVIKISDKIFYQDGNGTLEEPYIIN